MRNIFLSFLLLISFAASAQLELPYSIKVVNPKPLDFYYYNASGVPWANTAEVIAGIPSSLRYQGMSVNVNGLEYWFAAGILDLNLVAKAGGGMFMLPIPLGADPNAGTKTVITSDLGVNLAAPILKFNNNAFSKGAAGGWLNIILGSGSGTSLGQGGANVMLGNNIFPNLVGTGEYNGSENVGIGHNIGVGVISGSQNIMIGRNVADTPIGLNEFFYSSLIGYDAGKSANILGTASANGTILVGTFAGKLSGFDGVGYQTVLGSYAGYNAPRIGGRNTFVGYYSGGLSSYVGSGGSVGSNNTFIGYYSGWKFGLVDYAGEASFKFSNNTFIGGQAGQESNVDRSTFIGPMTGINAKGEKHFGLGSEAMQNLGQSAHNGGIGNYAGWQWDAADLLTGSYNYFFGEQGGYSNAALQKSINIGHFVGATQSNAINIKGFTDATRVTPMDVNLSGNVTSVIGNTAKFNIGGSTGTLGQVLTANGAGATTWQTPASVGITTASNGLTKVGNAVQLGGSLVNPATVITGDGYSTNLIFQSVPAIEFNNGFGVVFNTPVVANNGTQLKADAGFASINLFPYAGDPGTLTNGDLWYNSTTNKLRARINNISVNLGGGVTSVTSANADATVATTTTTPVITVVRTPALRSATTTVNVSSATAPTSGQVLTATSSTAATWQTPSGGGITRNINVISSTTAAASTSLTDYVYLCTSTITLTMPSAVGNKNRYTVKNNGLGVITINTTSSQLIDGSLTFVINSQYNSIDLISDGTNWNII